MVSICNSSHLRYDRYVVYIPDNEHDGAQASFGSRSTWVDEVPVRCSRLRMLLFVVRGGSVIPAISNPLIVYAMQTLLHRAVDVLDSIEGFCPLVDCDMASQQAAQRFSTVKPSHLSTASLEIRLVNILLKGSALWSTAT
jgi:hypothetical protein